MNLGGDNVTSLNCIFHNASQKHFFHVVLLTNSCIEISHPSLCHLSGKCVRGATLK